MNDFEQYVSRAGWRLCAIDRGHKAPHYEGWNKPERAEKVSAAAAGLDGAGLIHTLSGTCALDIDDLTLATPWLAERGFALDGWLNAQDAVRIESGRPGRTKLLYKMRQPLRTIKPPKSGVELRCANLQGRSVQDVLPPTIHPVTNKPYRWVYGDELVGHWSMLPPIPAPLLRLWRDLAASDAPTPSEATEPSLKIDELRKLLKGRDPNCEYDEWFKIGAALHHESKGSAEGFMLWCEWSKGITRKPYPGDAVLKAHWVSMGSTPGKRVATGASLKAASAATPEEFDDVSKEPSSSEPKAVDKRKQAIQLIESRLVYICQLDRYLDAERRDVLPTDHAIQHRFTHLMPRSRGSRIDPVKILRESPNRSIVDAIAFHPGADGIFEEAGTTYANTYRKLDVKPLEPTRKELEYIAWLFAKIDDKEYREWLMKFIAHIIQKPGVKIRSCPLVWSSATGTGKSTLLSTIPRELVGRPYHQEVDYTALEEKFNGYLRDKWVVSLKEFKAGTKAERVAIAQRLKPWITDDFIPIREMRTDTYTIPNRFVITATSNEPDAAPIDEDDRRWGVYELKTDPIAADEVREIIIGFFNGARARGVLTHYFRNVSLAGFNPDMRPPETDARREMIEASLGSHEEVLRDAWDGWLGPFENDCFFMADVQDYMRRRGVFVPTAHWIGRWLRARGATHRSTKDRERRDMKVWIRHNHDFWSIAAPEELLACARGDFVDSLTQ